MTTTVLAYLPSPSQGVWHLGPVPIRAYALCIIAGIIAALVLGDRRWEAKGGERGVVYDIALWAVPFGLIGGRLYHVMTDWQKYFGADGAGFLAALRIWDGGLGIWGAVALGGVGAWIACRRRGIPLPAFGDAIAPGIILAQAIGRLGNYFNQELYGRATDLPWGLTIYDRLDPTGVVSPHSLDGVSTGQVFAIVHPTFLYELLWNLLIFALLLWADRRFQLGHGRLFALYVAGYCVGRFWVELMRSDAATLIAGIRVNSFTSTFVFIGAVIYVMAATKGREAPESLRGRPTDESLVDEIGEGMVAVAATSGVVAAAKVAGDEDRAAATTATGGAAGPAAEPDDHHTLSEAAAENEDLIDQVENAPSEDIAEAKEFAAAGDAADDEREDVGSDESSTDTEEPEEREAGMGSIEGDAAVEAEDRAPDAHESAVAGAAEAEGLADKVAAEPDEGETKSVDETEPEEREAGMGSIEGDAAVEAEDRAPDAHDSAVAGAAEAEGLADKVAAEPDEPTTQADGPEEREAGMGSIEGDAATEAEDRAPDAHDSAVAGEAEAEGLADKVAAEPDEPTTQADTDEPEEREAGMGSIEGDAAVEAEDRAPDAHDSAVAGAAGAEGLAEQVNAEPDEGETEPEEREAGMGSIEGDAATEAEDRAPEAHESAVAGAAEAEGLADKVAAEPDEGETKSADETDPEEREAGMGSIEGDAATEAEDRAPDAHESAVAGAAEAEGLADKVAAEPDEGETKSADETEPEEREAGMGSVEGDAATEAEDRAPEAHESAVEGKADAEDLADEVNAEPSTPTPSTPTPSTTTPPTTTSATPRRRWWQRR